MRILTLDLSTSTGYAVFDVPDLSGDIHVVPPSLVNHGVFKLEKPILEYGPYPWCYWRASFQIAIQIAKFREKLFLDTGRDLDHVVIEETNLGKNRYSQKILEFIHCQVLLALGNMEKARAPLVGGVSEVGITYLSSSEWRTNLGLTMSKDQKENNRALTAIRRKIRAKYHGLKSPEARAALATSKKELGIKGKVTKKHVALDFVNKLYGFKLKAKDDDIADAICLGLAYINHAHPCDGA